MMRLLSRKKNVSHKFKGMKLYYDKKYYKDVSNTAAQKIGEALVAVRRPLHIEVDGEYLKTALIDFVGEPESFTRQEVSLEEVKKFERSYKAWMCAYGSLLLVGILRLCPWADYTCGFIPPRRHETLQKLSCLNPARFSRFSKIYAAMQEHYAKVDWAKRQE